MVESKSEQESKFEALSAAHLKELPDELDNENNNKIWVKAIVKVSKVNCRRNYAIAENDGYGNARIVMDFGSSARIAEIDNIYPYHYLTPSSMPDLRSKTDIINYLYRTGYEVAPIERLLSTENEDGTKKDEEQRRADKAIVKREVIRAAITNYKIEINERYHSRRSKYELINNHEEEGTDTGGNQ